MAGSGITVRVPIVRRTAPELSRASGSRRDPLPVTVHDSADAVPGLETFGPGDAPLGRLRDAPSIGVRRLNTESAWSIDSPNLRYHWDISCREGNSTRSSNRLRHAVNLPQGAPQPANAPREITRPV